jgi:4-cresol dehydrogenase (hydroxylating) cytochrome subunit
MKRFESNFLKDLFAYITAGILSFFSVMLYADAAGQWRNAIHTYASTCHYCHDTGVGPVLMGRQLPIEYIELRVRNGFNAMPSFKPSEMNVADLKALAQWIHQSPPSKKKAQ